MRNKLFYLCPFCQKAISTDLEYVTSHGWECSRNRTCLPIVLDNDHSYTYTTTIECLVVHWAFRKTKNIAKKEESKTI